MGIGLGIDFKQKILPIEGKKMKMMIWDTAGHEKFKTITQTYYKGAQGVAVVFGVDSRRSFEAVDRWMKQVHENSSSDVKVILVGNKCDLRDREVSTEEAAGVARKYNIPFVETSAMENINVEKMFLTVAAEMKKELDAKQTQKEPKNKDSGFSLKEKEKPLEKKKKSCC